MKSVTDCRQKAILPPKGGRIALSANERIAEFLDFAIQAKFCLCQQAETNMKPVENQIVCMFGEFLFIL